MSFRGRGGSNFSRGGGGFRGNSRGGGAGGRGGYQSSYGPPDTVYEIGTFLHACEGDLVCNSTNVKIPYFNAPIYLENKTAIGKVDEVLGQIHKVSFTVKPQDGIQATSFRSGDKFYIGGDKLLPLEKFLPKPKSSTGAKVTKRGRGTQGAGGFRGGRASFSRGGGRGAPRGRAGGFSRGGSRGGFGAPRGGGFNSRGGRGFGSSRGRGRG